MADVIALKTASSKEGIPDTLGLLVAKFPNNTGYSEYSNRPELAALYQSRVYITSEAEKGKDVLIDVQNWIKCAQSFLEMTLPRGNANILDNSIVNSFFQLIDELSNVAHGPSQAYLRTFRNSIYETHLRPIVEQQARSQSLQGLLHTLSHNDPTLRAQRAREKNQREDQAKIAQLTAQIAHLTNGKQGIVTKLLGSFKKQGPTEPQML